MSDPGQPDLLTMIINRLGGEPSRATNNGGLRTLLDNFMQLQAAQPSLGQRAIDAANAALDKAKISGTTFPDLDSALGAWSDAVQPIQGQMGAEINAHIFGVPRGWQFGPPNSSGQVDSVPALPGPRPVGGMYFGIIHTHPENNDFSKGDLDVARDFMDGEDWNKENKSGNGSAFVSMPNGQILGWSPGMVYHSDDPDGGSENPNGQYSIPKGHYIVRPARESQPPQRSWGTDKMPP